MSEKDAVMLVMLVAMCAYILLACLSRWGMKRARLTPLVEWDDNRHRAPGDAAHAEGE